MHSCTHWLRPRKPPPPSRIWAHLRGTSWAAKIDDISLWPRGVSTREYWTIDKERGFLAVVWFGSFPTQSFVDCYCSMCIVQSQYAWIFDRSVERKWLFLLTEYREFRDIRESSWKCSFPLQRFCPKIGQPFVLTRKYSKAKNFLRENTKKTYTYFRKKLSFTWNFIIHAGNNICLVW